MIDSKESVGDGPEDRIEAGGSDQGAKKSREIEDHEVAAIINEAIVLASRKNYRKQKEKLLQDAASVLLLFLCAVLMMLMVLIIRSTGRFPYIATDLVPVPDGASYSRDGGLPNQNSGSGNPPPDSIRPPRQKRLF